MINCLNRMGTELSPLTANDRVRLIADILRDVDCKILPCSRDEFARKAEKHHCCPEYMEFKKDYPDTKQEYRLMLLSMFNFYEPYIAPYNYGNYYYKQGRYEDAIGKYLEALDHDIPKTRLCDVEINLGLSYMSLANENGNDKKGKRFK